jgi:nucleoside triphosphate pyrophosphatase
VNLVLASNSPRRRQLLALGGWGFTILSVAVDEEPLAGENPQAYVLRLAISKARAAAIQARSDDVIVGSDTAVVDGETILGKPVDNSEAERMLRRLRGRVHQVYTALAVVHGAGGELLTDICKSDVYMRDYSDSEMSAYIESGDPLDKAGAYAIQHAGFHPVKNYQGCFANVMGLPVCHLARLLDQTGIKPQADVPMACRSTLATDCLIYPLILQRNA